MKCNSKLVIYTCLFGDTEPLGDPTQQIIDSTTDLDITFVCVTNNRQLTSETWSFLYLDDAHLPMNRLSRKAKMLPHIYFPNHNYSLYIDNIVNLKRFPQSSDLALLTDSSPISLFKHRSRDHPTQEAEAVIGIGYDSAEVLCGQLDFYFGQSLQADFLATCTVIYRLHSAEKCIQLGEVWWEQYLMYSKRDQISFPYVCTLTDIKPVFMAGHAEDCDLIFTPEQLSTKRMRSNFDHKKYAWLNRDKTGKMNSNQHFLSHSREFEKYARHENLFEFYAFTENSPIGSIHSPRRNLCNDIYDSLSKIRHMTGNCLFISGIDNEISFNDTDSIANLRAFSKFLPNTKFHAFSVPRSLQSESNLRHALNNYTIKSDCFIFTDISPDFINELPRILYKSINQESEIGFFILITTFPIEKHSIDTIVATLDNILENEISYSLNHSHHDSLESTIPQSLLSVSWG